MHIFPSITSCEGNVSGNRAKVDLTKGQKVTISEQVHILTHCANGDGVMAINGQLLPSVNHYIATLHWPLLERVLSCLVYRNNTIPPLFRTVLSLDLRYEYIGIGSDGMQSSRLRDIQS